MITDDCPCVSTKTGFNVENLLEKIATEIPSPNGEDQKPLKALIFDFIYNDYKGALVYVKVNDRTIKVGDEIKLMYSNDCFTVTEVGYFTPGNYKTTNELSEGEFGYIAASIKSLSDIRVGDTITNKDNPANESLPGYKKVKPMVYCGLYPMDGSYFENLKIALEKLKLNDAAL